MTRLDRVGRGDTLQILVSIDEIMKLGAIIHTREDGDIIIVRSSDIIKPFFRALTGGLENEARADKARAGHARRKAAGLHDGNAPYGVVLIDGHPRPREPAASVVREIFELRAQGFGLRKIAKRIIERCPPAKTLRDGSTKALLWDKSTVAQMLRCSTYRDVVVESTLFDSALAIKKPAPNFVKSGEGTWPLAGSVFCSCGRKLSGRMSGRAASRQRYYVCYDHPGAVPHFRAEFLESAFETLIGQIAASEGLQRSYRSPKLFAGAMRERVADLQRALNDVEVRHRNILGHAELLPPSSTTAAALHERLSELDLQRARILADLKRAKGDVANAEAMRRQAASAAELLQTLPAIWPRLTTEEQRDVARLLAGVFNGLQLEQGCTSQDIRIAAPKTDLENVYVCLHT